jgi:hypothetical protein
MQDRPGTFFGFDVRPVAELAEPVLAAFAPSDPAFDGAMIDFDDRDLARLVEAAGPLGSAPPGIRLSRATLRTIRQDLGWAFAYNVSVIANALRLRRFPAS